MASYDEINNLYTKYLGRPASQDEYNSNWANNTNSLSNLENQISTSDEARRYNPSGTPAPLDGSSGNFAGFDASRLDSNTLKYNAMKVLQGFDPNSPGASQNAFNVLNAQSPGQYQLDSQGNIMLTGTADGYIGARPVGWGSGGSWYEPGQGAYDWQWLAYNDAHQGPQGEGAGVGGGAPASAGAAPAGGGGAGGFSVAANPNTPGQGSIFGASSQSSQYADELYKLLMGIATGSRAESANANYQIDPNDPIIKRQVDAYDAAQQRAARNQLSALAEKRGTNANLDAETRMASEQGGQATGAYQASLMANELGARRQEVAQALEGARGLLTAEQAMQLQEELQHLTLAQQAYQFDTQQQYLNSPLGSAY